ncbi:TRM11 family SAM-dependent methyltransferase [Paenibacillus validus]|uniref:TRM11 family SAM-dependent methyltransferase n=2 Tax=Paenibacillus validus TaxID=44253 RepID=UPI001FD6252E|nr:RsmD family RNA methyltransferase [Paenibacillus validus]MED4605366.1 RsmD family RNA methyltransferase [Paenibacillus validus]
MEAFPAGTAGQKEPMMLEPQARYVYTFAYHEDEASLCALEQRVWFGVQDASPWIESELGLDLSRSPFMKQRLDVMFEGAAVEEVAERASGIDLNGDTFKVIYVPADEPAAYEERRALERQVGARLRGKAEMRTPKRTFGLAKLKHRWVFGELSENAAVWLRHKDRPRPYSTALSTRVARAIMNIAVPQPAGVRAVDPCCGIGTVLIEALSMGMDIEGFDVNPLAVRGARENLRHFGYPDVVKLRDMREVEGGYDTAILDLPYNLCSKLSEDEQLDLLRSARRMAQRVVVIAIDPIEPSIRLAGLTITDGCIVKKGSFARYVTVCER